MTDPTAVHSPLCFTDTETTGLGPRRLPWEIAMIRREPNGDETTVQFFIGDIDLSDADPQSLTMSRFYERHPLFTGDAGSDWARHEHTYMDDLMQRRPRVLSRASAAPVIARFTDGAHLVGAVPSFDAPLLEAILRDAHRLPRWHYHLVDVEALAAGYLRGLDRAAGYRVPEPTEDGGPPTGKERYQPPWRHTDLIGAVGAETDPAAAHTALGDARTAMNVYDTIMYGAAE